MLLASTDKIQLVSSAAVTLDSYAWYADVSTAVPPVVQGDTIGRQVAAITTATTTDIVAAPAASELRQVRMVNVRNKHATTSCDVTVAVDVSGTDYELHKATLRAGEVLQYRDSLGWYVIPAADITRRKLLVSDHANTTTTATEATGLSLTTGLGAFKFQYLLRYQTAATATGIKVSCNHAGTVASFVYNALAVDTAATAATGALDQDMIPVTGGVYAAWSSRVKSTDGKMITVGVDSATSDMLMIIDGLCDVTADGELELWWGSEVGASAATIKAGSALLLEKIA